MPKFDETFEQFAGALELPDDFRSALTAAYREDISEVTEVLTEKESTYEQEKAAYEQRISSLKTAAWDALRSGPTPTGANNSSSVSDSEDEKDTVDIRHLFTTPKYRR